VELCGDLKKMSKNITRANAIKALFYNAKKIKMDVADLHLAIDIVMMNDAIHISLMSAKDISKALKEIFDEEYYVEEDKMVYKIRNLCDDNRIKWSAVETLIRERFGKKKKIISIYHLTQSQKWKLFEVIEELIGKEDINDNYNI